MKPVVRKNWKTIAWIFSLWTGWVFFYGLVMYFQIGEIPWYGALFSSAFYNYVFTILSIFIWFICKKLPFEKIPIVIFFLFHFFLGIFFTALWLFIFYGLWYWAMGAIIFEMVRFREIIGWQFLFGMVQYFLVAGIYYTIIYYQNYRQIQLDEAEYKLLLRDAELKALKLQMNPHFLFNSLNSINALITQNPALSRKMISQLSDLLRMSLKSHDKLLIPLKEELDLVHTYLQIEQIRFEDKMKFQEEIDPELLTQPFPAMLLQPLLENAVKHGIANSRKGGIVLLRIKNLKVSFQITVQNQAYDSELISQNATINNGTGITNIRQRLDRLYGEDYQLEIDQAQTNVYRVCLELPFKTMKFSHFYFGG